jgi:hypothetical protein
MSRGAANLRANDFEIFLNVHILHLAVQQSAIECRLFSYQGSLMQGTSSHSHQLIAPHDNLWKQEHVMRGNPKPQNTPAPSISGTLLLGRGLGPSSSTTSLILHVDGVREEGDRGASSSSAGDSTNERVDGIDIGVVPEQREEGGVTRICKIFARRSLFSLTLHLAPRKRETGNWPVFAVCRKGYRVMSASGW